MVWMVNFPKQKDEADYDLQGLLCPIQSERF